MRLEIKKCKRIGEANLNLGEITIIAGKNDIGKSTISRLLYAIISGLSEDGRKKFFLDYKNKEEDKFTFKLYKKYEDSRLRSNFISIFSDKEKERNIEGLAQVFKEMLEEEKITSNEFASSLKELEELQQLSLNEQELLKLSVEKIIEEEFQESNNYNEFFKFPRNLSTLKIEVPKEEKELISLINKDTKESYWTNLKPTQKLKMTPFRDIIYLESPFLNENNRERGFSHLSTLNEKIKNKSEWELSSECQEIIQEINEMFEGNYVYKNRKISLEREGIEIKESNVATGIRSLGTLKILLENGHLREDTYLILDEPEVHLHPEWQVKLAKIITLLNKKMGVRGLISSHSPYFIEAIDIFKDYYKIEDVNYYLGKLEEKRSIFIDYTEEISNLFKELSNDAFDYLDNFKERNYLEGEEDAE